MLRNLNLLLFRKSFLIQLEILNRFSLKNFGCNNFTFTFFQSGNSNNISVKLPNYKDSGTNVLHLEIYMEFKRDLTSLLSLLNGAEVKVRKEFTGEVCSIGKVNSQSVITYSFKTINNESYNQYVPLNNAFHRGDQILNTVFIYNFNKYVAENKKIDLDSIIIYLNAAEQARGIEEKVFILMIAFERIAQKLVETLDDKDLFILSDEDYKPIKDELFVILNKYRFKNTQAINDLKGKIGDINRIKNTATKNKFLKLLKYANISSTPEIESIIDEVRHKTVHHREIGEGNQGLKNYFVLDELLRDIILNIIGYDRARISRYRSKNIN
ncbi:hypothetical protein EON73_05050 [bacterium]|nr:MAG: hypothetical protein EON73_05050 [bacterium]